MRNLPRIALTILAVLILSSGGLLVTHAATPIGANSNGNQNGSASQALSMTLTGGVVSAGNQQYLIQQNGPVTMASMANLQIDPSQPMNLNYQMNANVQGLSVSGAATFELTATSVGGGLIDVTGNAVMVDMIPAVCLPSFSTTGICAPTDTSAVPAFFVGVASIQITTSAGTQTIAAVPMLFESAYLNPFGAPVVFGSADSFNTLLVVTPYSAATINWSGTVLAGQVQVGPSKAVGTFTEISNEQENLVAGTATDSGMMMLSHVVGIRGGSATGTYSGISTIPTAGSSDCSASIGLPSGSGVCTQTGFQSRGTFNLSSQSSTVTGSYSTTWSIPAFAFAGTASATVTTP